MSAVVGNMTGGSNDQIQGEASVIEEGPETSTDTQEASPATPQKDEALSTRGNLRHRILQKTGLSHPQPKDDTVEYPADDEYGLFEQVIIGTVP